VLLGAPSVPGTPWPCKTCFCFWSELWSCGQDAMNHYCVRNRILNFYLNLFLLSISLILCFAGSSFKATDGSFEPVFIIYGLIY